MGNYGYATSVPRIPLPAGENSFEIACRVTGWESRGCASKTRAGGIRTHDLLNPIQAHYQAVLRPDVEEAQDATSIRYFQAGIMRARVRSQEPGIQEFQEAMGAKDSASLRPINTTQAPDPES